MAGCLFSIGSSQQRQGKENYGLFWKQVEEETEKNTEEANTVHHIYPADKYPEYAWCDWNLISVSQAGHNKLENRLTGELTALGKQLMEQTRPGVDWRRERKINLGN